MGTEIRVAAVLAAALMTLGAFLRHRLLGLFQQIDSLNLSEMPTVGFLAAQPKEV